MSTTDTSTEPLAPRLTTFPRIESPYCICTVPDSAGTSKESLIHSWAMLLRGYQAGDVVSFMVDGQVVSVDFSNGRMDIFSLDTQLISKEGSAVYYNSVPPLFSPPPIYAYLDHTAKQIIIAASQLVVPSTHVSTLCVQLSSILHSKPTLLLTRNEPANSSVYDAGLSILNHPPQFLPGPKLLHDLLFCSPTGVYTRQALDYLPLKGDIRQTLTYSELEKLSTRFARKLCFDPGNNSIVPILVPQSPKLYIALLGILKAGGAFVPLQSDTPIDRIKFVVSDVRAQIIVADRSFQGKLSWSGGPRVVFIGEDDVDISSVTDLVLDINSTVPINPTSPAYVMYTSGSTGTPKGILISHLAITQSLLAHGKYIPGYSRFLQFASPSFDVFVFEVFFTFFRGATLVGCERSRLLSNIVDVINCMDVDALELTPTVLGELVVSKDRIPGVKVVLTIGEMLTQHIIKEFGDGKLHGMYGPTEASIHCTIAPNFCKTGAVGDIGIPLDTVSAFILGPAIAGQEVTVLPVGWVGELAIGGPQLADGYLNLPEQTAEAYIDTGYGRLYRTGDRARMHPRGTIELIGRISSDQVKFRGQRIELGEIEEAIRKISDVNGVVVSLLSEKLIAFVVCGKYLTESALRNEAKKWLPSYMVPSIVVTMTEIPKLSSGKADKKRLEREFMERCTIQNRLDHVEDTMDDLERTIANAVVDLLEGVSISKESSFIANGLDSLLAIRLCSKLRASGMIIQVVDILQADCVQELACRITSISNPSLVSANNIDITKVFEGAREAGYAKLAEANHALEDIEDIIPCTTLQEMMLTETIRDPTVYSNWILLEVPMEFSDCVIEAAFRKLVQRNEILRTGFLHLGQASTLFLQVIWDSPRVEQFHRTMGLEKGQCFEVDDMLNPPFRGYIFRQANNLKLSIHIHHAIYDGWSWDNILKDFNKILAKATIPNRPQFREVVSYSLKLSASNLDNSIAFWKKALDAAPSSKLPDFYGYSGVKPEILVNQIQLRVPRQELELVARKLGVSPQVITQTAWAYLLGLYIHSSDITFGTVVSGRTIPLQGIEEIIGPCISTLPLRVKLGDKTRNCADLMREVHDSNRMLLMHSGLDLRQIRKLCGVGYGKFDTLLVWQQTTFEVEIIDAPHLRQIDGMDHLEYSLLLEAEPFKNTITLKATYNVKILPPTQVAILLSQLDSLVTSIVSSPFTSISSLSFGLEESLLSILNPYPLVPSLEDAPSLAALLEKTTDNFPDAIALQFVDAFGDDGLHDKTLTYSQLNTAANILAHKLLSMGIVADDLVCLFMEKSPLLYISILAIVKAGAGYLPLSPDTPVDRLHRILYEARVQVCLSTSDLDGKLSMNNLEILNVDKFGFEGYPSNNPMVRNDVSCLAYAVFTSGSTGVPKGVLVTQKNIITNIKALKEIYPYKETSKILQFSSQAFDVSVFEIFFAWTTGICLCTGTKDTLLRDLEGVINAFEVTHLSLTPTVATLISPAKVPTVEFLVTAGEAVTQRLLRNWAGHGLYQGYGPSETTNICTINPVMTKEQHVNNIGTTLLNTSAFILAPDDGFELIPRGGVGELCFGGSQVGRGYLNMPDITSKKFISHPRYGGLYRSGDLGRLLPDGCIAFVGREDDQVKIRGHRIELGEINSVLLQQETLSDAITLTIVTSESSIHIVSFIVPQQCMNMTESFEVLQSSPIITKVIREAFRAVSDTLATYMIPTNIVPITKLPMTSLGKIDKGALQRCYLGIDLKTLASFGIDFQKEEDSNESWTLVERALAKAIAQLANVPVQDIERNTSIFRLGLDSISAIHLSRKVGEMGYRRPEVSQIMQHSTVANLAEFIEQSNMKETQNETPIDQLQQFSDDVRAYVLHELKLTESDILTILPCTPLQEAMLTERVGDNTALYYNYIVFELGADILRLKSAWDIAIKRNDIFRTCFCVIPHHDHAYAQVVLKEYTLPWAEIIVQTDEDVMSTVHHTIGELTLAMGIDRPPLSFKLFKTPIRSLLMMLIHHSLYDGFAMDLLLEEVQMAYYGLQLPTRTSFSSVLNFIENRDVPMADIFWKNAMDGIKPVQFPDLTGKSNAHKAGLIGMAKGSMQCSGTLRDIENGCKQLSTSLLALGQSIWARLLAVLTGESDICFGNVVSGRTIPVSGVEEIIAPCFNTIPVRVQLTPGITVSTLAVSLQRANAEALHFQHTPLRRIMKILQTEGQVLFDTLFILQHAREPSLEEIWKVVEDGGEMDFAVVLELIPRRKMNTVELVLHFRRDIMDEDTANIILSQLDQALYASLYSPDTDINDYNFMQKSLLSISNSPPEVLPETTDNLLHSEFEKWAEDNPDGIALEFLEDTKTISKLSYRAFNEAANRIAHQLLEYGVKRDEAIPICLEKCPQFYICILAILKSGCSFTPIDPSTPPQRIAFMLKELNARFAVTDSACEKVLSEVNGVKFVILDSLDLNSLPVVNPRVNDLSSTNLAYRLYTSGSTGLPKAVSVEIRSALQTIRATKITIPWTPESRLLQFSATTFDMCYFDCFIAWNYGFVLCSTGKRQLLDDLEETIKSMDITMLFLTPAIASTLCIENHPRIDFLSCAGEAMTQSLVSDWEGRCVNSYGPTEATMICTMFPVNSRVKCTNIGSPLPTSSFHVFSSTSSFVLPKLGCGELCIGGTQLAREYHNNPKLTKERFITIGSERLYRTGDTVRMLTDDTFEFIGRFDDQVKIRGLRVELDEINHVIKNCHQDIKEATTIVLQHSANAKEQLVSFLSLEGRKHKDAAPVVIERTQQREELLSAARATAQRALPTYMVPGVMIIVDHIPLSPSGKVNKNALKALFTHLSINSFTESSTTEIDGEWNKVELEMRDILAEVSQLAPEKITKVSTIYQIGLDSISAAQVAMKLRKRGLLISVIDILECPSIKQLSPRLCFVNSSTEDGVTSSLSPFLGSLSSRFAKLLLSEYKLLTDKIITVYPCTAVQEGMLSQFLNSETGLYFNHYLYRLSSTADISRLKNSWKVVMDDNDILRAGFFDIDDHEHSFVTAIYSRVGFELPWTVRYTNDNDIQATVEKRKSELTSQVLESLTIPPWYLTLFVAEGSTQLLFSAHHALYDAQSLNMILDAVLDNYLGKHSSNHPHFSGPLSKIVQSSVDAASLASSRSFWLKQLEGYSISRFPCLTPTRVHNREFHVVTQHSLWPLSQIKTACQNLGLSLHAVAQAAWVRVLSAYIGETQVTYGLVLSGRTGIPGAENVVFPCLTTIPSVVFVSGSNHELVSRIQDNNIRVLQHQHTPLRLIQSWLGTSSQSLFDSIFVYQKTPSSGLIRESPLWVTLEESGNVDYNVSVEVEPTQNNHLVLRATCRDYVLPREQTVILLQQFDAALMDILCNSSGQCTDFSYFSSQLLAVLPPSTREIPSNVKLLHQFVEKHCDIIPNTVALEFATVISESLVEKRQWTYKELDVESNKVANFLRNSGLGTGDLVGICFDKSAEASFAIIGTLKAGCGYVALDPTAPIDRKLFILKDSQARCILTMDRFAHDLRPIVTVGVYVVGVDIGIQRSSTERPNIADLTPGSLCYCLYTSGTTGTPKGCMITHENTVQAMLAFQRIFQGHWDKESKFLQFASFHFDVSVLEQFWSWSVGVCLTSTPRDVLFEDLALAIRKLEITHLDLTPSLAALLIPEEVPSLLRGIFIVGGEALKQDILDTWGELGVLYNAYGPTEVTIGCTILPRVPQDGKPSNIGLPLDNVGSFVMVLNTDRPTLRGAIGELCLSGKLVGKGYINQQDLTRDKFPYLEKYGERIYRTGDLVRVLHNGCFDFLGRADDQIKLRGQRLEIGEINATIKRAHPAVNAAATLVLKHPKQQKDQLVSFISLGDTAIATESSLLTGQYSNLISTLLLECKKKLPVYMVPTHIIPLSRIPLSVNNKVNNKSLAKIYMETPLDILQSLASKEEKEDSLSTTETQIQSVLANMAKLHLKDIKSSSTIFELGLDSVSVVSLARKLKKCGFHRANVSLIMQNYTLETLAQALSKDKNDDPSFANNFENVRLRLSAFAVKNAFEICEQLRIDEEKVQHIFPCSALQEGMILRFINSDDAPYFVAFALELNIGIDLEALKNAWDRVRKSIDILRTCFCDTSDGYAQVVLKDTSIDWSSIGIIKDQDIHEAVENERLQLARLNRKLQQPPIHFRVMYTPSRTILLLNIFHALYDGISVPLILGDVEKAYHNQYYRRPNQFSDILPHILSCNLENAENFWKQKLGYNQFSPFPRLSTRKQKDIIVRRPIKASGLMIEEGCKTYGCTAQSLFQAAWASVLAPYVGNNVTFGVVISGRTLPLENIESTIGPIFNTIPCFLQLREPHTWRDLVRQAHKFNAESIPYHHTPLRLIRKWLSVPPGKEVFDSLFVYRRGTEKVKATMFPLWKLLDSSTSVDFPLALDIEHDNDGILIITIGAKGDILSKEDSLELIDKIESAFITLLRDPDSCSRIIDISVVKSALEVVTPSLKSLDSGFEWTPVALTIRRIVATLTGLEESEISNTASLFELGLDSIEVIKLSARLRRDNIQASVSTIMRNPTIRKLSIHLKEASVQSQKASDNSGLLDFEAHARKRFPKELFEAIYPTTPLQEAMIAETLVSDYRYYFNHDFLKLDQGIDLERFHNAWKTVIQHNPILRTSFFHVHELGITSPHAFGQVVHKKSEVPWMRLSLTPGDDLWVRLQEAIEESAKAANLMERPPLLLTILTAKESHYLLLSMSHALYDGWSLGLLHTDIYRAYHDSLTPRPSPTPLLETILKNNFEESSRFWRQLLQGVEASVFPVLSNNMEESITHRKEFVSKVDYTIVVSFCKRLGITLQTLGQTCWSLILAHYTRRSDLLFGTVLSGRDTDNAEEIMFPAMNTVPVRVIPHGTYKTMLQYMQDSTGNMLRYQYSPLRTIQRFVKSDGIRIFDTLFICQRAQPDCQLGKLYKSIRGSSDLEYKVCVEVEPTGSSLVWRVACKSSVMALDQVENMLQVLDSLLGHMVEHPDFPAVSYERDTIRFGNTCPIQIHKYSSESTKPDDQRVSVSEKASWNPISLRVRRVLAAIANLPEREIKHHQTIFHLGLDSISAIRVSSELRKEGIFLGVSEILRNATIEKIALAAAKDVMNDSGVSGITIDVETTLGNVLGGIDVKRLLLEGEIEVESLTRVMPATPGQVYMLSVWQNTGGKIFMPTFSFRSHLLDSTRLQIAWERLTKEEPILRTTFMSTGDENNPIIQLVLTNCEAQFDFQEGLFNTNSQLEYISMETSFEQRKAISLMNPPVRIKLINIAMESVILLTIHHALYDGVSLPLLLNKLRRIYNSVRYLPAAADPLHLSGIQSPLSTTFADVVAYGISRDRSKQEDFWCKYLDGTASTLFSSPIESVSLLRERISIFNPTLFSDRPKLESHCRKHGITIQSLVLASFSKTYAEALFSKKRLEHRSILEPRSNSPNPSRTVGLNPGQDQDIVIGVYLSNRHLPVHSSTGNLYDLTAPTLNLLPLRVRHPKSTNLHTLARAIQKDLGEISNGENSAGVSMADIEKWTRKGKAVGVEVDVWFNYLRLPGVEESEVTDCQQGGESCDDSVDAWTTLEEIKTAIPATAAEGQKLRNEMSSPIQAGGSYQEQTGGNMLARNVVRTSFMDNLDIEVSVTGKNIGLGIFAQEGLMDYREVEDMLEGIKEIVDGAH